MNIGARIEQAVRETGLCKAEIARRVRVQWLTVHDWMRGKSMPSAENLADLARVTRVRADWLLGLVGDDEQRHLRGQLRLGL